MRVVYAYRNYGCKTAYLNEIVRFLFDWQIDNFVRIEIVYVNTKVDPVLYVI